MICAIGIEQQTALTTALHKILKQKDVFNLNDLTKQIYDIVLEKSGNKDQALAYARMVPTLTSMLLTSDSGLRKQLKATDFMNDIVRKADLYEESIDNVVKDMPGEKTPVEELVEGQKNLEDLVQQEKEQLAETRLKKLNRTRQKNQSEQKSFFSTLSIESKTEPFPFVVQRAILERIFSESSNDKGASVINYPGVGPLYLRPVKTRSLDEKNWRRDNEGNLSYTPQDNDVTLALVDKDGNFVYMDEKANVTTEDKGRIPTWQIDKPSRFIKEDANGKFSWQPYVIDPSKAKNEWESKAAARIKDIREKYTKAQLGKEYSETTYQGKPALSDEQKKKIMDELMLQLSYNYYAEKLALEKPETKVMINILGGNLGLIQETPGETRVEKTPLSSLNYPIQVQLEKTPVGKGYLIKPYFLTKEGNQVYIDNKSGLSSKDADTVMNLLFNEDLMVRDQSGAMIPISPSQRHAAINRLMYVGKITDPDTRMNTKEIKVTLGKDGKYKIEMKPYDPSTGLFDIKAPLQDISDNPNARALVIDYLSRISVYHVNKQFTDSPNTYAVPFVSEMDGKSVVSSTPMNYFEWIKSNPNFRMEIEVTSQGSAKLTDSFFTIEPTEEAVKEIIAQKPSEQRTPVEKVLVNEPVVQPTNVKPADYTNHSGGAYGGDTFWDIIGREFGVTNHKHYREEGNKSLSKQLRDKGVQATVLTKEQMDQARAEVKRLLGKEYPDTTEGNLQVRNYYQVANSDAVFAIAQLDINKNFDSTAVFGGTNTAVQLGIKLNKPVYVWDLSTKSWHKWNGDKFEKTSTPVLTKNFAGVGSRDIESYSVKNKETGKWEQRKQYKGKEIEDAAKQAIREVYENTFGKPGAQPSTQPTGVKVISEDYGVVVAETNPSKEFDEKLADAIYKDVAENAYVENGSDTAQRMWANGLMWKGNNTKKPTGKPLKVIPAQVDYNANGKLKPVNTPYFYDPLYNDGTPVAPISDLDFLKRHIEKTLGIDMSDYDVSLNNIYEEGHNLFRHTDIDESNTAKNYPVIVYVFGNTHKVRFDDNGGKRAMGAMVNPKTLTLKNGDIYTFGMDGKGRFETVHDVVASPKTDSSFPPLIGADGKPTNKYTVTFTFRRAGDLTAGMPTAPAKLTTQPSTQPAAPEAPATSDKIDRLKDLVKRMDKQMFEQFLDQNPDLTMQTIDFEQWEKDMRENVDAEGKPDPITDPAVKEEWLSEGGYFEIDRPTKKDLLKKLDSTNPLDQKYFFYDVEEETDISLSEFADRFNNYAREVAPDLYYRGTTQEIPFQKDTAPAVDLGTKDGLKKFIDSQTWDKLDLQKTGNIKATPEQIEEARKWYESSPLAKHFPFEAMFNAINPANARSVAQWSMDGIKLYKGSDYSDLYHEAWHGFSQTFLTPDQRKEMYDEMRKKKFGDFTDYDGKRVSFAKATDLQLEEYIAEKFREYVLSKGTKVDEATPKTNNIFKRIWNFLKELFGAVDPADAAIENGLTPKVAELFEKLRVGNLGSYTFNANNRSFGVLFSTINALDPASQTRTKLGYQDTQDIVDSIDSVFSEVMDELNSRGTSKKYSVTLYKSNTNKLSAYKVALERFKQQREKVKAEMDAATDPAVKNQKQYSYDLLTWAIDNFGNTDNLSANIPKDNETGAGVIYAHIQRSKILFGEDKAAVYEADELSEDESYVKGRQAFERGGSDSSLMDLASKEVIYLIRGLYKRDKNGNIETNSLGFNKLNDFGSTWNSIAKELEGTLDPTRMQSKLDYLASSANDNPQMRGMMEQLISKLGNIGNATSKVDNDLWTNFWQTFNKTRVPLIQMTLKAQYKLDENGQPMEEVVYNITLGEAQSSSNAIVQEWENRFATVTTDFIKERTINIDKDRNVETENYLDTQKVLQKYPDVVKLKKSPEDMLAFLADIGIRLSDNKQVKNQLQNSAPLKEAVGYLYQNLSSINQSNIEVGTGAKKGVIEYITSVKDLFGEDNANRLKDFKDLEAKYGNSGLSSFMVSNAEGNTQFEHSLNSSLSVAIEAINRVDSFQELISLPYMSYLDPQRNPFVKSSIWLKSIFVQDQDGNFGKKRELANRNVQINFNNLSGVKSIDANNNEDGIASASSDPTTKLILDFHSMMLLGRPELPRHADKGSSYSMYVSDIISPSGQPKINKYKYIDDTDFIIQRKGVINTGGFKESSAFRQILGYVMPFVQSELERIKTMQTMEKNGVTNYDFTYMKKGQKFVIFDDVFSKPLKTKLIEAGPEGMNIYKAEVEAAIADYFQKIITKTSNRANKGMFKDASIVRRINKELKSDLKGITSGVSRAEIDKAVMASFVVNSWLHNLEAVTLMYGDLALYNHEKEEFHKRNAGAASTGDLFRTDKTAIDFVNGLGRRAAAKEGIAEKKMSYDGTFDTAVFEDSIPPSKYFKEYEKAITDYFTKRYPKDPAKASMKIAKAIKAYKDGEIKEGDGQGWISFDAYRIMLTLQGKWSDEQETLYNKIIKGEEVSVDDVTQFFPVKKVQYWGHLQNGEGPPVMAMHKFSLMPLIPNLIKGTNLEKLHTRMMKQEIDYALFKSGSKIGNITKNGKSDRFYSDQATRTFDTEGELTKNTIFLNFLKDQLETGDKYKGKVTSPSQMRKLLIDGLVEQGLPIDFKPELGHNQRKKAWEKLTEQQKKDASPVYTKYKTYEERVDALTKDKYQKLLKKINFKEVDGKPVGDIRNLVRYITKQLELQDLSEHEKAFIQEYEGRLKNDLSLSLSADKIERVLNSIVVKELVRQKVKGEGLIQVSSAGFEKVGEDSSLSNYSVVKDDQGKSYVKPAGAKISLQGDFKTLLDLPEVKKLVEDSQKTKKPLTPLQALNIKIRDEEWLNTKNNRKMIMFTASRIPVQGKNSMEFMQVEEFLPPNGGNIIVVPSEIVAKSGSDFDIDKLFVMMPTLFKDKKTGRTFYDEKSAENKVLESQIDILSDANDFVNLIRPNGTDIFDDMAADLQNDVSDYNPLDSFNEDNERVNKDGKKIISATRIFEIPYNLYKHNTNNIGKQVLGIGAVDNTFNVLFNRIGMHMNLTSENLTFEEYKSLREDFDQQYKFTGKKPKKVTYTDRNGREITITGTAANNKIKGFALQKLRLNHNTVQLDNGDEVISLSHVNDAENDNKISDVISQMINGWVDVARDTWIFNIQGNKEISPTLLFLVQAGVPVEEAVYFVSQPLVREYVQKQRDNKSTFAGPLGDKPDKPNLAAYEAERDILKDIVGVDMKYVTRKSTGKTYAWIDRASQFDMTQKLLAKNPFDKTEMRGRIKKYGDSEKTGETYEYDDFDKAAFLHFLEVEKMAKAVAQIKMTFNVDTQKQATLYEARDKQNAIKELEKNGRFPVQMLKSIQKETAISSFFDVLGWQQEIWGPYFKIRDSRLLNDKLDYISDMDNFTDIVNSTFGDAEKFNNEFRNDFLVYLFQKKLYSFDLESINQYKGYRAEKPSDVVPVEFLEFGVFFKDGVAYVDKAQLKTDFENLGSTKFLGKTEYKVASVETGLFDTPNQYYKFVFEREYLRSVYPLSRVEEMYTFKKRFEKNKAFYTKAEDIDVKRITYEETLRDMALTNSYNMNYMFKGRETMGHKLYDIFNTFPELKQNYDIMKVMGVKKTGSFMNIKLSDKDLTSDKVDKYHENLMELGDPNKIKMKGTYEDKKLVADFFRKLDVYAILQSGMNVNSELSLQRIVSQEPFLAVMKPIADSVSKKGLPREYMEEFSDRFYQVNKYGPNKNKFKNYGKPATQKLSEVSEEESEETSSREGRGNPLYNDPSGRLLYDPVKFSDTTIEEMVKNNPNTLFVFDDVLDEPKSPVKGDSTKAGYTLKKISGKYTNVIGIKTKRNYSDQFDSASVKDAMIDGKRSPNKQVRDSVDAAIDAITKAKADGKTVAFAKNGYGQILINASPVTAKPSTVKKDTSMETFRYISEALASVDSINPNYLDKIPDAKLKMLEKQPITDQEVYEKLKSCFMI